MKQRALQSRKSKFSTFFSKIYMNKCCSEVHTDKNGMVQRLANRTKMSKTKFQYGPKPPELN